jgi:hypothetical protein
MRCKTSRISTTGVSFVGEARFEEWISPPWGRRFVAIDDHQTMAGQPGWWMTGWHGTAAEVEARKAFYATGVRPASELAGSYAQPEA